MGRLVGSRVGLFEGLLLGFPVGALVGFTVGSFVGAGSSVVVASSVGAGSFLIGSVSLENGKETTMVKMEKSVKFILRSILLTKISFAQIFKGAR